MKRLSKIVHQKGSLWHPPIADVADCKIWESVYPLFNLRRACLSTYLHPEWATCCPAPSPEQEQWFAFDQSKDSLRHLQCYCPTWGTTLLPLPEERIGQQIEEHRSKLRRRFVQTGPNFDAGYLSIRHYISTANPGRNEERTAKELRLRRVEDNDKYRLQS